MSYSQLVPLTVRPCQRLLLYFFFSLSFIAAAALHTSGQTQSGRPVARLISSTEQTAPRPQSARMITAARPVTSAAVAAPAITATTLEQRAFELINAARIANGAGPLVWDAELCRMARLHSQNMARMNFFAHAGPDGLDTADRARASGVRSWSALGENIAYNQGYDDPSAVAVDKWMHSTKHRTNILNTQFTRSGLGIAQSADGRVFLTQVFIAR